MYIRSVTIMKKKHPDLFNQTIFSLEDIKKLGSLSNKESFDKLLELYFSINDVSLKREIVSSIGRQNDKDRIFLFIKDNVYNAGCMDVVYQMFRTCLYNSKDKRFLDLQKDIMNYYENEVLIKMLEYYTYRHTKHKNKEIPKLDKALLLEGDNINTLKMIKDEQVQLIFTSPPYYNARQYSNYNSYKNYLNKMEDTLIECNRVLEEGRFIIINVSPVITKRPGREFESIRYPIHFDFHKILEKTGFYFIDEIIWIKPEYSVPNRNGGYQQTKKPLSYKPNCVTESLLVYRKKADFLLDKNIKKYHQILEIQNDNCNFTTNCWYINPKADKNHPAVFPEKLCEMVLKYYSYPGDVVLDPFAGTGTLGRVALNMGRIPVLCEKDKNYINIIKRILLNG